jgi:hypothetical protein
MTSTSSEVKLKRFLHYGRETALYEPGDRYTNNYFEPDNVTSIEGLIADGKETDPVAHIVKVQCDIIHLNNLCTFYHNYSALRVRDMIGGHASSYRSRYWTLSST